MLNFIENLRLYWSIFFCISKDICFSIVVKIMPYDIRTAEQSFLFSLLTSPLLLYTLSLTHCHRVRLSIFPGWWQDLIWRSLYNKMVEKSSYIKDSLGRNDNIFCIWKKSILHKLQSATETHLFRIDGGSDVLCRVLWSTSCLS